MSIGEFRSRKLHRDLLKDQDSLVKIYSKPSDANKLRSDFCNLRVEYLRNCLKSYTEDLCASCIVSNNELKALLEVKLNFYVQRFTEDLALLAKGVLGAKWKNRRAVEKFSRAGRRTIKHLLSWRKSNLSQCL